MTQRTDGIAGPIVNSSWERNIGSWVDNGRLLANMPQERV